MFQPREVGMSHVRRSLTDFYALYCENFFVNDAVHSREKVAGMLDRGKISETEADRMLRMRYKPKGNGVVEDHPYDE